MSSGKIKGGTTGCRNVSSLQPSKQHALCKMAYSVEHMSIVKNILPNQMTGTSKICSQPSGTLHTVQDAIWYGGACIYCQNILQNK
jgi:hypothetical protein